MFFVFCADCPDHSCRSNGIDAINFRALRESKSVDFDRDSSAAGSNGAALDVIHGKAGSPSVVRARYTRHAHPERAAGRLTAEMRAAGKTAYETEVNPFEEFRGVTRDIGTSRALDQLWARLWADVVLY